VQPYLGLRSGSPNWESRSAHFPENPKVNWTISLSNNHLIAAFFLSPEEGITDRP